jgi:hypothetical protein
MTFVLFAFYFSLCFSASPWHIFKMGKKKLVTTYSPARAMQAVPSALVGLTSLFGMGRGVTPPL